MKTKPNQKDPIPNFAQAITSGLVRILQEIIAQFLPNLQEISDRAKNT